MVRLIRNADHWCDEDADKELGGPQLQDIWLSYLKRNHDQDGAQFADLVIHCGRQRSVRAHRCVLVAVSSFWKHLLTETHTEYPSVDVILGEQVDLDDVRSLIELVYKGQCHAAQPSRTAAIQDLARWFDMTVSDHVTDPCPGSATFSQPPRGQPLRGNDEEEEDEDDEEEESQTNNQKLPRAPKARRRRVLRSDLTEADLTCSVCGKTFTALYKLKLHMLIHGDTAAFVCSFCGKGFNNKYKMRRHERIRHTESASTNKDRQPESLGTPEASGGPVTLSCPVCKRDFKSEKGMKRHACQGSVKKKSRAEAVYCCTVCQLTFPFSRDLKSHINLTGHRPQFKCQHCGLSCSSRKSLKIHGKTAHLEAGEAALPYKCNQCGKAFLKQSYLEEHHNRFHSLVKPFSCMFCPKHCATKQDLHRHLLSHKGEPLFNCQLCSRSFVHRASFKKHQRSHVGDKPYQCFACGSSFGLLSVLKKHHASHLRKGDMTQMVTAPRGRRGCLTYIDWDHVASAAPKPQPLAVMNEVSSGKKRPNGSSLAKPQVYIPSVQYIHQESHTITPLSQLQVIGDYGEISSFPAPSPVPQRLENMSTGRSTAAAAALLSWPDPSQEDMTETEAIAMDILGMLSDQQETRTHVENL